MSRSRLIEKVDENNLASFSEEISLEHDRTMKCSAISKDDEEDDLIVDILLDEVPILSSVRAYLKFNRKGSYMAREIEGHVASDYKQLVYSVATLNKFINARQQVGRVEENVPSPQCGSL